MFRSNGFNERNVKLFFANGHKQGIEKGASSPYMYMYRSFSLLSPSCQLPHVYVLVIAWCEHVHAEAVPGSADPSFEVVRC